MFFPSKKDYLYPKKWPIFLGFRKGKQWWHTVETMTHFASPVHVSKTFIITIRPFCFLSAILNLCKYGPNVRYLKKLKSYFFLNQKSWRSVQMIFPIVPILRVRVLSGTVCPVSGILKLIMAYDWPSWKFSEHIPTWNRTFCFVVPVLNGLAIWQGLSNIRHIKGN